MRELDLIIYGATGFTGQQAARYIASQARGLRWGIAGRNPAGLRALQTELHYKGVEVEIILANSDDPASVDAMVARTRVLLTTAGPYAKYGTPVVESCVRHGTHYVDITGETPWVREMIDRFHDQAAAQGTRLVPLCGVDSVPSDLGAWMLAQHLRETLDEDTAEIWGLFSGRGGLNGGTVASALNLAESGQDRLLADPFLLNPAPHPTGAERKRSADVRAPLYHAGLKSWVAPWAMGPINTRVVRRSHALLSAQGAGYGEGFTYQEGSEVRGRGAKWMAQGITLGMGAVFAALRTAPGRRVLGRLAPSPGEGPSEETMDHGFLRVRFMAEGRRGTRVFGRFQAQGDPGNRVTVLCLCECALALLEDADRLPPAAGILTPAVAFGPVLAARLRNAGVQLELTEPPR